MKIPNHKDEVSLEKLLAQQKRLAWDLNASLPWHLGVDLHKPLVPLDSRNIAFDSPLTNAERLVVSQLMGLMIASTFSEMEMALGRLRVVSWDPLMERYGINPEIRDLGEEFFDEEDKHALAFERYVEMFANAVNVDRATLKTILPTVDAGLVEKIFQRNAEKGGLTLWWVVATVEEQSQLMFRQMKPFQKVLDPLYFELHRKHFEEEARHASYAFLILKLCAERERGLLQRINRHRDYLLSELVKMLWLGLELSKIVNVRSLKHQHPFFETLHSLVPKLKGKTLLSTCWRFLVETPYLSSFLNPQYHPALMQALQEEGMIRLPLPKPKPASLGWDSLAGD